MKILSLVLMLLANTVPATAKEFSLSDGETGPIVVSMQMHIREQKEELVAYPKHVAELTATARNDSGRPIRYAKFCVQADRRQKGCDFEFSNRWVWMPGEEMVWMIDKHARPGIEKGLTVMLLKIQTDTRKAKEQR
jgi:hypothetical protein